MKIKHRVLASILSMMMILTFMPAIAFADDEAGAASGEAVSVEEVRDEAVSAPAASGDQDQQVDGATEESDGFPPEKALADEEAAPQTEPQYPANGNDECFWVENSGRSKAEDKDGVPVKGLFKAQRAAGKLGLYYADESGTVVAEEKTVTVSEGNLFYYSSVDGETGWSVTGGGPFTYLIKNHDGDYYITNVLEGLETAGGKTYYVKDGRVQTAAGVIEFEGNKYYVQEGGEVLMTAGFTPDHKYYIPAPDGKILTTEGTFKAADGKLYYAKTGGEIPSAAGLYGTGDSQFYVNDDGTVKTDEGFKTVDGKKYLVNSGGAIRRKAGAFKFNGNYYVAEEGGAIITTKGIYKVNGKIHFVKNKEGVCSVSKAFKYNGKSYHSKADGTIAVGVHKWNKNYYYSKASGEIRKKAGIVKWNNKRYYVQKTGKVIVNKKFTYKKKTYIAGTKGAFRTKIFTWKKNKYYANSKGEVRVKAGLFKYDGNRYYSKKGGILYKNTLFSAGGNKYLAQKDATIRIGYYNWKSKYYLTNEKGAIYTREGIYTYNKTQYYVKSGGAMANYEFVTLNDDHYFVNSDGSIAKSKFTYKKGGKKYTITPNSRTGKISLEDYWKVFPEEKPEEEKN